MFCRGKQRKYKVEPSDVEKEADKITESISTAATGSSAKVAPFVESSSSGSFSEDIVKPEKVEKKPVDKWEGIRGDVEMCYGPHVMKLLESAKWDSREVGRCYEIVGGRRKECSGVVLVGDFEGIGGGKGNDYF